MLKDDYIIYKNGLTTILLLLTWIFQLLEFPNGCHVPCGAFIMRWWEPRIFQQVKDTIYTGAKGPVQVLTCRSRGWTPIIPRFDRIIGPIRLPFVKPGLSSIYIPQVDYSYDTTTLRRRYQVPILEYEWCSKGLKCGVTTWRFCFWCSQVLEWCVWGAARERGLTPKCIRDGHTPTLFTESSRDSVISYWSCMTYET